LPQALSGQMPYIQYCHFGAVIAVVIVGPLGEALSVTMVISRG